MQLEECLEKSLSELDIWKRLLKSDVYLYPDGFYRLSGIFGHSATFGFLKINKNLIQMIRNKDGSIKEPWLTELAHFMKSQRSKRDQHDTWDNHVLVIVGIMKILTQSEILNENSL